MRWSPRRTMVLIVTVGLILVCGFIIHNGHFITSYMVPAYMNPRPSFSNKAFKLSDFSVRDMIHYTRKKDIWYENFISAKQNSWDRPPGQHTDSVSRSEASTSNSAMTLQDNINRWKTKPIHERCQEFFQIWLDNNENWSFEKNTQNFDKSITDKSLYFSNAHNKLKIDRKGLPKEKQKITKEDNMKINKAFLEAIDKTVEVETRMMDTATIYRAYGKCFLKEVEDQDQVQDQDQDQELFKRLTDKLFPYLNNQLPQFERWDGHIVSDGYPDSPSFGEGENILRYIKDNVKGKGIVISASTKHGREILKLIRVLRALNNNLPIHIMHKGDLSNSAKEYLIAAAQCDVDELLKTEHSTEYGNVFPSIDLQQVGAREYESYFPKQELWFVNIKGTIAKDYKTNFPGYANKLLALFFTSFKEVIVLDADTVPLLAPIEFLSSEDYRKHKALFFRDRSLRDHNDFIETNFFTKLMPTLKENSVDYLFDIPTTTDHTLSNTYMTGWRHLQEAGVVAIDKRKHLSGILFTLPLTLWKEPVASSTWGDKELYWIGLSMSGDEEYVFNEYQAASVGTMTTEPSFKSYHNSAAREVCSTHPGHIDKNGHLLWINSGFSYCKKNGYFRDRNKFPFSEMDKEEKEYLYNQPVHIQHAIVPPSLPNLRQPGSPIDIQPEIDMRDSWGLRPKDFDEINVDIKNPDEVVNQMDWNPQKGWVKSGACSGYYYCAYDLVDSYAPGAGVDKGHFFEFDAKDRNKFEFLSKMWVTGTTKINFTPLTQKDITILRNEKPAFPPPETPANSREKVKLKPGEKLP